MLIVNQYAKSREEIHLDEHCAWIYKTLNANGHKVRVNRYGLLVSGKRRTWNYGWFLAMGLADGTGEPKIIKTFMIKETAEEIETARIKCIEAAKRGGLQKTIYM